MKKVEILKRITQAGVIAVVRADSPQKAEKTVDAIIKGGVTGIELTFTVPHADQVIAHLSAKYADRKDVVIGAGTVLDPISARIAIINGADFIVSPSFSAEVAEICNLYEIPYTPGCMSPTEIQEALKTGVDLIKIFPSNVLTPKMISEIKGPFPYLSIMSTGGINVDNMADWFKAGVTLVGTGGSLTAPAEKNDFDGVTSMAKKYHQKLEEIRSL